MSIRKDVCYFYELCLSRALSLVQYVNTYCFYHTPFIRAVHAQHLNSPVTPLIFLNDFAKSDKAFNKSVVEAD